MAKDLGDIVEAHASNYLFEDADEDTSVGECVDFDGSGDLTPADTEAGHTGLGVRPKGDTTGTDNIPVVVDGVVIASVDTGISAGDEVGPGNATDGTVGQLVSGGDRGKALCDEGGTYKGASLDANEAAILLY